MVDLTEEQRAFVIAQARNQGGAQAALQLLRESGFSPVETIAALLSAATATIEATYADGERLHVLNLLLAESVAEWGGLVVETRR